MGLKVVEVVGKPVVKCDWCGVARPSARNFKERWCCVQCWGLQRKHEERIRSAPQDKICTICTRPFASLLRPYRRTCSDDCETKARLKKAENPWNERVAAEAAARRTARAAEAAERRAKLAADQRCGRILAEFVQLPDDRKRTMIADLSKLTGESK